MKHFFLRFYLYRIHRQSITICNTLECTSFIKAVSNTCYAGNNRDKQRLYFRFNRIYECD